MRHCSTKPMTEKALVRCADRSGGVSCSFSAGAICSTPGPARRRRRGNSSSLFPTLPKRARLRHPRRLHPVNRGDTLAKLKIPRLETELYVVEGDGQRELRRGPGHLAGTAMPGENGNCVIAGHRDTHFRVLKDIREGDDIILQTSSRAISLSRQAHAHRFAGEHQRACRQPPRPELNLITCYPFYYVGIRAEALRRGGAACRARSSGRRRIAVMPEISEEFHRIQKLPPYVFAVINEMRAKARAAQIDVIDLGMGNPDGATPRVIVNKLVEAARNARNHRYSQSRGIPALRGRSRRRYKKNYGVSSIPKAKRSSRSAPRTRWRTCCSPRSDRTTRWFRPIPPTRSISTAC